MSKIAVFCSSQNDLPQIYKDVATDTGRLIGERGHALWYGGTRLGLMGIVAQATQQYGGHVTGVLPHIFTKYAEGENELIMVEDLKERMRLIESRADAFIALSGGLGTLEEISGVLVAKQLYEFDKSKGMNGKPLVLVNTNGIYNPLISQIELICSTGFAPKENLHMFHVAETPLDAIKYIENYKPSETGVKQLQNTALEG